MTAPLQDASLADAHVRLDAWSVWFASTHALDAVSLVVPRGGVTALIGPSGCGKSTVLRSINRLDDGQAGLRVTGRILLDNVDIHDASIDPASLRRRIGMVFQRSNPFRRSILENVVYGPRLHGLATGDALAAVAERALRRAALWEEVKDRLGEPATSLSGGQQQRLCIARALANEPDVLLLDEPTSALDPGATQRIEELLYDLRTDVTIVIVTHNLQQAARVSDHTAFLLDGRLVEVDATRRLFTSPRDPRTEAYITGRFG
ncbi:MAG: phosphate ABC transporter ATP-binding protein PstB [Gemmatimonadaceae bacterium]|jgi:phosphate transport system ATP-binding protein|nr:phosphate ABC transporter ATP-binding protein PstB [Gemmatimonadaceae bacterium]